MGRRQRRLEARIAGHDHEMLNIFQRGCHQFEDRNQVGVHQHHLVAGVVDDVGQVVLGEANVGGVSDRAHVGRREVRLEVPVGVPAERSDPVAPSHTQTGQRIAQPVDPFLQVPIGVTMNAVALPGDDLLARKIGICPVKQARHEQLVIHHGALPPKVTDAKDSGAC